MNNTSMGGADSGAHSMNDPVQKLINSTQYTHTAVKSGAWSDPKTWSNGRVPDANAKVLIKQGSVVTYDQVSDTRIETVAIEGNLKFATNQDTQLKVKTILNAATGKLDIGAAGQSVAADKRAKIIFTSDTAFDSKWDPEQLSKGLVSRGGVNIYGADKSD
ncbi:MAG: G8 domain-containing protein, partial [Phormidesmis sp.]